MVRKGEHLAVILLRDGDDVDAVLTEVGDEAAARARRVREAHSIVDDAVQRAEAHDEAASDQLAGAGEGSRPE